MARLNIPFKAILVSILGIFASAAPIVQIIESRFIAPALEDSAVYVPQLQNITKRMIEGQTGLEKPYPNSDRDLFIEAAKKRLNSQEAYCRVALDNPGKCTFTSIVQTNQLSAEWILFNNKCETLKRLESPLFPDIQNAALFSPLKFVTSVNQRERDAPPSINYAGDWSYTNPNNCFKGGESTIFPFFRLGCRLEFDCSKVDSTELWHQRHFFDAVA